MRIKQPCEPGCDRHVTHPCERCGQQWGLDERDVGLRMFWKKTPMTQWFRRDMTDDATGIKFNCAEQYMMWAKAEIFHDHRMSHKILGESSPAKQQKMGRLVENYDQKIWDQSKCTIVVRANFLKFSQNEDLKEFLLRTENDRLIEASPYDRIWGIGYNEDNAMQNINSWGQNLLGWALEVTRTCLKE